MKPENTRVWRKTGRRKLRGAPTGRRGTHPVETTYGHQQRDRDWRASWEAMRAQFAAEHGPVTVEFPPDAEA